MIETIGSVVVGIVAVTFGPFVLGFSLGAYLTFRKMKSIKQKVALK